MKLNKMNPNPATEADFSVEQLEKVAALFNDASMIINSIECEFISLKDNGVLAHKLLVPLPKENTLWVQLVMLKRMFADAAKAKKLVALMAMILLWCNAFSQGYISTSVVNKGVAASIGYLGAGIDINAGVQMPITEIQQPTIYSLSIGRIFYLSENDGGLSLTPSFGVASLHKKQLVKAGAYSQEYNRTFPYDMYEKVSAIKPYYSLEIGKDAHLGRVFLKTVYSGNFYYSAGMRLFFNRNN